MPQERLQKIISRAGVASRRKAEELITQGQVTVNGELVTELGAKADLDKDHIKVSGRLLRAPRQLVYLALHKPRGCVTTVSDPEGRPTVMDYLKRVKERVFPVGRLDYDAEGLLLFTNDGEFANWVAKAGNIEKTYLVKANGPLSPEQQEEFRRGIPMFGRKTAPAKLRLVQPGQSPWYEVKITEGRQNQIKIMFRHCGRLVEKLRRIRIGFLSLGALEPGESRMLSAEEVARFRRLIEGKARRHGKDV